MTGLAVALVLSSAFIHATWNYFAKRVGGGATFIWLMSVFTAVIYAPLAIILFITSGTQLGLPEIAYMGVSAVLHVTYFTLLSRGYRVGDFSVVYPLAR